jgi:hypothetical protein
MDSQQERYGALSEDHNIVLELIRGMGIQEARKALEAWVKCQETILLLKNVYQFDEVVPTVVVDHAHCND